MTHRWQFLGKCHHNHKWFQDRDTGQIACADDSGYCPEDTEDGILWLNRNKPIVLGSSDSGIYITTPVICDRTSQEANIISGLAELLYLVEHHGMEVEVAAPNGQKGLLVSAKELDTVLKTGSVYPPEYFLG